MPSLLASSGIVSARVTDAGASVPIGKWASA